MSAPLPRIVEAEFAAAAAQEGQLPAPSLAEIAFAGRSNVGKSSLMNALLERKSLVRASSKPGTTRQINLFRAKASDGLELVMVDLPGYGFAQRSKSERKGWGTLIEGYLASRVTLRAVVLLVDVRRGLEPDDVDLLEYLDHVQKRAQRPPVQAIVVATKIDKLPTSARKPAVAAVAKASGRRVLGFSAVTAEGRDDLWRVLRRAVLGGG